MSEGGIGQELAKKGLEITFLKVGILGVKEGPLVAIEDGVKAGWLYLVQKL